jgi:dTDP-4-dehydrorhamnose reductase
MPLPRVLVTGAGGQVGCDLITLGGAGLELLGFDRAALDITRPDAVDAALDRVRPRLVVNLAAYTAVDKAEDEPDAAFAVNRDGAANMARACRRVGIPMIQVSTDYVFDGTKEGAWREDDPVAPLSVYGKSKAAGEAAVRAALADHAILRASWVFGAHRRNFVRTMLGRIGKSEELRVVDDQRGCPTAAADLACALVAIAHRMLAGPGRHAGTYHYCNDGETTWFGFAQAIFARAKERGLEPPRLVPIKAADYAAKARRPGNSVLDCTKTVARFGIVRPPWRESLKPVVDAILAGR